jgi:hypothetical protein
MRGRKPRRFLLAAHDKPILKQITRSRTLPWFQVQRARVVLAIAEGGRVQTVGKRAGVAGHWKLRRKTMLRHFRTLSSYQDSLHSDAEIRYPGSEVVSC